MRGEKKGEKERFFFVFELTNDTCTFTCIKVELQSMPIFGPERYYRG